MCCAGGGKIAKALRRITEMVPSVACAGCSIVNAVTVAEG